MNKHLPNSLRALFLSLAVLLSMPMLAEQVEIDGVNYDFNAETKQATVIAKSSDKYSGEVLIPESVEHGGTTYSVTGIGWAAFHNCSGMTSVTIPNSVTSIGDYAFYDCSGLTSVTIGNSVTSIGDNAFQNCSGLTSVTIGNSVTSIGSAAFKNCSGLTSVTIPNSVTSIGDYAFYDCSGLTSVTIGNSVTSIGYQAFCYCSGLTSVTIGNSVTSIGSAAFKNCSRLTSVTIGNSVTSIGYQAFCYCWDLTSVTIGNSVTSIGDSAFKGCSELIDVYCYAENVPSTPSNAFDGSPITDAILHVPAGSVDRYNATAPWRSFENIVALPPFSGEVEIDGINYELNGETKQAIVIAKSSGLYSGEVVIPESVEHQGTTYSVTSIGNRAFQNFSGLTSVTIPNSVTSIGSQAFWYCSGLTSVTIPNSVKSIGELTFADCSGLTSVTIGNSVTSIGDNAFRNCSGLTSVTIGNSVTSIGSAAFKNCSGLTSVTIPNSVTSIGDYAFSDCSGLTSVTIGNSVTSIGYQAFCYCSGLTSVTIGNSVTSIGDRAFYGCNGLTSVTIPNSVTSIGYQAFCYCWDLTSVTIGNSVTSIGDSAFKGCSELIDVYCYAENVPSTPSNAFDGSPITDAILHVPAGSVDRYNATAPWRSFENIVALPPFSGEVEIDGINYELNGETKQAIVIAKSSGLYSGEVVIPESVEHQGTTYSVTSIGASAFRGCTGLTSVTIPNSVTSIGKEAFYNCSELLDVYCYAENVPSTESNAFESSPIGNATLHVPAVSVDSYEATAPWNSFGKIVALSYSEVEIDGINYELNGETKQATVIAKSSGEYSGEVVIPESVEHEDVVYSVTSIGQSAFKDCSGLTSVTIGNSVTSIGGWAFEGCSDLLDVYCYAENVPSTESDAFDGIDGEKATLHVPAGSIESYKATSPWSGFGTIKALPQAMTIVDGEVFENETEQTLSTLTYTRTLPNMLWNPLYVPFKIPYEDLEENYEVAYINAMHSYDNDDNGEIDEMVMEIVKIKAGTLKPNHPYLIKAKNEEAKVMNIVQEAATLYPAEITTLDCSSVYTKFEITGTYQKMTSGDLNGSLVISTDGAWKKLSPTSTLKPFRFYLTISSREGSPVEIAEDAMSRVRIRVMGEDDNATGIDEVKTANEEQKSEIYDLSGRRVSAPAKGGVYVINGKKVIY